MFHKLNRRTKLSIAKFGPGLLAGTMLLTSALTYLPALALGPLAEGL